TDTRPPQAPTQGRDLPAELSAHLGERLPGYMIPSLVTVMPSLPLSGNGKVDRKALAALLTKGSPEREVFEAPLDTPLEQQVAAIWRELLEVERISRNDDFFHIGGSSLTAINLLSLYLARGYDADIDLIFNNPRFRDMVAALERSSAART